MATKNDERIIELKKVIEKKREELNNMHHRFVPRTIILSADSLKIPAEEIKISGFSLVDWACDISEKIESIKYRDKKRELTNIEKQLNSLLSDDKQTELQIDSLESLLKS